MKVIITLFFSLLLLNVFAINGELKLKKTKSVATSNSTYFRDKAGYKCYSFVLNPTSLDLNKEYVIKAATVFKGLQSKLCLINDVQEIKVTPTQAKKIEYEIISGIAAGTEDKDRSIIGNMSSGYMAAGVIVEIWDGEKTKCLKHWAGFNHPSAKTQLYDGIEEAHLGAGGYKEYNFKNATIIDEVLNK